MRKLVYVGVTAAVLSVFVPLAVGDQGRSVGAEDQLSSCGERGWPATAEGSPAAATRAYGYYTWHDRNGWHLRIKVKPGATSSAEVSANAPLVLKRATSGVRSTIKKRARSIAFTVAGTGTTEEIDFKAACAGRLSFRLGGTVYLGARGTAPARSFALARPVATGVAGRIIVGPTCAVVTPDCPPAKSVAGTVRIETAPSQRGGAGGQLVKVVESDAQGNFSAALANGLYMLTVVKDQAGPPFPKPSIVPVEAGVVTQVTLVLDTGIRSPGP